MNKKYFALPIEKQQRILNAYYEQYPEIKEAIGESFAQASRTSEELVLAAIDTSALRPDIDKKAMYEEIIYAMDGYMLKKYRSRSMDPEEIEKETAERINFWRKVYTKKEK